MHDQDSTALDPKRAELVGEPLLRDDLATPHVTEATSGSDVAGAGPPGSRLPLIVVMSDWLREVRAAVGHALLVLPGVSGFVFDEDDRLLLIRGKNGLWNVTGGAIEPDESPADAVRREMREETGLVVEPARLIGVFGGPGFRVRYSNGDEVSYVTAAFECRIVGGTLVPDGEEALDARYFAWREIDGLDVSAFARAMLNEVRQELTHDG